MEGNQQDAAPAGPRGRRDFLRASALGGLALAAGGLAACADAGVAGVAGGREPRAYRVTPNGFELDFASDLDVLNYAYALEQLEAAFYTHVITSARFTTLFSENERRVLTDLRDHEVVHRDFLKLALNADFLPNLTPNFSSINFGSRQAVLETARTFEDLGVAAYNGAGRYLRGAAYLTLAGKIVSVEARHAAAIRSILQPRTGAFAPNAFDMAMTPQEVLAAAAPFVVGTITVVNT